MSEVTCHMCSESVTWAGLQSHAETHIRPFQHWLCGSCQAVFPSLGELGRHCASKLHPAMLGARADHSSALLHFLQFQLGLHKGSSMPSATEDSLDALTDEESPAPPPPKGSAAPPPVKPVLTPNGSVRTMRTCLVCHATVQAGRNGSVEIGLLKLHILRSHSKFGNAFGCPVCKKKMSTRAGAKSHIESQHMRRDEPEVEMETRVGVWNELMSSFTFPWPLYELQAKKKRFIRTF